MTGPHDPHSPDQKNTPLERLSLIRQREIEARIVGPIVRAFVKEVGPDRGLEIVRGVISQLARDGGESFAAKLGDNSLDSFAGALDLWKEGDALVIETLDQSPGSLDFNVTRCRYAEMYHALGLGDLGFSLSCQRDFALIEGFNPDVTLTRTQTIMEGAPYCDFRFRARPGPADSPTQVARRD